MNGRTPWWVDDIADTSRERPPPADDAPALEWILYYQSGVVGAVQALACMSRGRLRHLVDSGQWQRLAVGVFVAHSGPLTRAQQLWAAVLGCGPGAVLGGLSAACAAGLRREPGAAIHVLIRNSARRRSPGRAAGMPPVVVHRTATLPEQDLAPHALPARTTMPRSLVDAAQWAPSDDAARAFVAAGCRQRLTTPSEIFEVVARMPRAHRRDVVLEAIGYVASGAEAVSEINFAKLCRHYGLPPPDRQVPRTDRRGRKRYLDAYWRKYRIQVEVDGGYHLEPESYWADMTRQNSLWISGEKVLRFSAWAIVRQPEQVAAQLREALTVSGWHPG